MLASKLIAIKFELGLKAKSSCVTRRIEIEVSKNVGGVVYGRAKTLEVLFPVDGEGKRIGRNGDSY